MVSVNDEQLKEWKASADPVYKTWADSVRKIGGDPDVVLKDLRSALEQYKASF
jgi:TRAP-type transport system periplasmic protein